jgi:nicotinamidase-related amidase
MITSIDKNTALVLIDLQKGIAKGDTAHPVSEVLRNAAALVDAFRKAKLPVVILNVNPSGAAWTKARVEKPTMPPNTTMPEGATDIVPEIITDPSDILITKKTWNAFYNTDLDNELQKRKITGIVLGGISTSAGVEGTARAASERGYNISFATDAMTDKIKEAHNNSISYVFPRIGELGTTDEIIKNLPI